MGIDSARREEPKTGLPPQIGHQEGIPPQWSPKSPYVYLQYTTQSVAKGWNQIWGWDFSTLASRGI